VFATGHKPLIDDLGSIVATGIDMDAFFDDGIGASSQRLSDLVSARLNLRLLTSCGIHFEIVISKPGKKRTRGEVIGGSWCPAER
jgi:hypothetical protein